MRDLKPGIYLTKGQEVKAITEIPGLSWSDSETSPSLESVTEAVPYLFAAYRVRADKLAGMPRVITDDSGNDIDEEDLPFNIDINDLLWRTEFSLNIHSVAYWWQARNTVSLKYVRWLDPTSVEAMTDREYGLYGFKRNNYIYPLKDGLSDKIVYFWLPGLRELSPGTSYSQVLRKAGEVLKSIDKFSDAFFDQGGMPITLLVVPPQTRDEDKKTLEGKFARIAHGVKNAFKPIAVRSNIDVKQVGSAPADMAMTELTTEKRDAILSVTGVPISLITGTAVNYATAQQEARNFIEGAMIPRARLIESVVNKQLFGPLGYKLKFHPDKLPVMSRDVKETSEAFGNFTIGGLPPAAALHLSGVNLDDLPPEIAGMIETPEAFIAQPQDTGATDAAKSEDLHRWKRKARKAIKAGQSPAVKFVSDAIPEDEALAITAALTKATSIEEVDAVFMASPFLGYIYQSYP